MQGPSILVCERYAGKQAKSNHPTHARTHAGAEGWLRLVSFVMRHLGEGRRREDRCWCQTGWRWRMRLDLSLMRTCKTADSRHGHSLRAAIAHLARNKVAAIVSGAGGWRRESLARHEIGTLQLSRAHYLNLFSSQYTACAYIPHHHHYCTLFFSVLCSTMLQLETRLRYTDYCTVHSSCKRDDHYLGFRPTTSESHHLAPSTSPLLLTQVQSRTTMSSRCKQMLLEPPSLFPFIHSTIVQPKGRKRLCSHHGVISCRLPRYMYRCPAWNAFYPVSTSR